MHSCTCLKRACAVSLVLLLATAASAQYAGPWTHEWDFETGTQGWSLFTETANSTAYWYNGGGNGPNLAGSGPSNYGGNSLHLIDGGYARILISDFTPTELGANGNNFSGKQGFILQADAWLPNLSDGSTGIPTSAFGGTPGNSLSLAGVGVEGTNIALYAEGKSDRLGLTARDFGHDNTARNRSGVLDQTNSQPNKLLWWDAMITFQIDYGFTTPGKWTAYGYVPFQNNLGGPGWYVMSNGNYNVHPDGSAATFLQLGGRFSWTQAQFDNVKLYYVPEPASLGLLALAALPMLRRRRTA